MQNEMIFKNISIIEVKSNYTTHLYDNSINSKNHALLYGIPYMDTTECEQKLKETGILLENENLIIKNKAYNNTSNLSSLETNFEDSKGNKITTLMCDFVNVYFPIDKNSITYKNQSDIFNSHGYDIFDSKSEFFNNKCSIYSINKKDITLKKRREIYGDSPTCPNDCIYEKQVVKEYFKCKCDPNKGVFKTVLLKSHKFKNDISDLNFKTILCPKPVYNFDSLVKNIGLWTSIGISLILFLLLLYGGKSLIEKLQEKLL